MSEDEFVEKHGYGLDFEEIEKAERLCEEYESLRKDCDWMSEEEFDQEYGHKFPDYKWMTNWKRKLKHIDTKKTKNTTDTTKMNKIGRMKKKSTIMGKLGF